MRDVSARRAAIVIGLFVVLFGVRFVLDDPTYIGVTFLLVLPTVLAALWFGVTGGLAVAAAAAVAFFIAERLSTDVALHTVTWASIVRFAALALVAVLVARLFTRQLALVRELDELEAVRDALRPAVVVPRPSLDLAAHYVPAEQGVGGDFFLTAEGPRGSTVLLVGDVVGKGVQAARRAVFVRTSLVTFAPFEDDPARLLRLANAALIDRAGTSVDYVTAVCVVHRPADETLAWAIAGHPPPLRLEDGSPLDDWGAGQPLGLDLELAVASRVSPLEESSGVLLYTDGILDARDESAERFGEERLRSLVASHGRESAPALVEQLRTALAAYAPAGGDDVCLLAARSVARWSSPPSPSPRRWHGTRSRGWTGISATCSATWCC
jgi:serine phosphatase RsbU (regulator of sigma subunit)